MTTSAPAVMIAVAALLGADVGMAKGAGAPQSPPHSQSISQARPAPQSEPEPQPRQDDGGADTSDHSTATGALRRTLGLRGSVRSGLWSASRSLDDRGLLFGTSVRIEAAPRLGSRARAFFDGRVGVADVSRADDVDGEWREAYLDVRFGRLDLRAGKQIVAGGRADGVNPTDNLTPRDLTLLVPEVDDQRTGVAAVRATAHVRSVSVTGVWLAQFTGHTLPLPSSPGVEFRRVDRRSSDESKQFAVKVERVGGSLDGSISYFSGFDQLPDVAVTSSSLVGSSGAAVPTGLETSSVALALRSHRINVIGGDLAAVSGRVGIRAEAAYTRTEDRRGDRPEIKNPTLFLVAGVDRTFHDYGYVNPQYTFRFVENYQSAEDGTLDEDARRAAVLLGTVSHQGRRRQHGATFKISNKWLHETLEAEATGVFYASPRQGALRAKVNHAVTDRWRVVAGAELLRGDSRTLFDLFRDASSIHTEVRFGF